MYVAYFAVSRMSLITPVKVLSPGYKRKMLRIRTMLNQTQMIQFPIGWYLADKLFIGESMRTSLSSTTIVLAARIWPELTISQRMNTASPLPTRSSVVRLIFADFDFCPEPGKCIRIFPRHMTSSTGYVFRVGEVLAYFFDPAALYHKSDATTHYG